MVAQTINMDDAMPSTDDLAWMDKIVDRYPWADKLQRSGNGKGFRPNVGNLITILSEDPHWKDSLAWNEFTHAAQTLRPPPWPRQLQRDASTEQTDEWQDSDITRLQAWVQRSWGMDVSAPIAWAGLVVAAEKRITHPVRTYLKGLKWDGGLRLQTWLQDYLGAGAGGDDGLLAYLSAVGTWWMISAVARVMQPGCKADCMLVLDGEQGEQKSTVIEVLACGFFSDTPLDLDNKDRFTQLQGVWIQEFAELDGMNRSETSRIKSFISSRIDTFRPPYGRSTVRMLRRCVFAGTCNHGDYLRDETGNRRFWPVTVGLIDIEGLKNDRDQLWAEAVHSHEQGQRWWPEKADDALCRTQQRERTQEDAWQDKVEEWLPGHTAVTVGDVLERCLDIEAGKWTPAQAWRIPRILKMLGWKKTRITRGDGTRPRVYVPVESQVDPGRQPEPRTAES